MDAEALGFRGLLGVEGDLGVGVIAVLPGSLEALEGGAVVEAGCGGGVIEALGLDRLGARWGPGGGVEAAGAGAPGS